MLKNAAPLCGNTPGIIALLVLANVGRCRRHGSGFEQGQRDRIGGQVEVRLKLGFRPVGRAML